VDYEIFPGEGDEERKGCDYCSCYVLLKLIRKILCLGKKVFRYLFVNVFFNMPLDMFFFLFCEAGFWHGRRRKRRIKKLWEKG